MRLIFQQFPVLGGKLVSAEGLHAKSRIREVKGGDLRKQIRAGNVVVVAGFQGVNEKGDVTTFGGGSDLSAIALAGSLRAKLVRYLLMLGCLTADPRIVSDAKILEINYEEMLELASSGSKVMQTRAVGLPRNTIYPSKFVKVFQKIRNHSEKKVKY